MRQVIIIFLLLICIIMSIMSIMSNSSEPYSDSCPINDIPGDFLQTCTVSALCKSMTCETGKSFPDNYGPKYYTSTETREDATTDVGRMSDPVIPECNSLYPYLKNCSGVLKCVKDLSSCPYTDTIKMVTQPAELARTAWVTSNGPYVLFLESDEQAMFCMPNTPVQNCVGMHVNWTDSRGAVTTALQNFPIQTISIQYGPRGGVSTINLLDGDGKVVYTMMQDIPWNTTAGDQLAKMNVDELNAFYSNLFNPFNLLKQLFPF